MELGECRVAPGFLPGVLNTTVFDIRLPEAQRLVDLNHPPLKKNVGWAHFCITDFPISKCQPKETSKVLNPSYKTSERLTVPLRINEWDEFKDFNKVQQINSLSRQLFVALCRKSMDLPRHHVWVLNPPLAEQWGGTPSNSTVQFRHHRRPYQPSIEANFTAYGADTTRNKDTSGGRGAARNSKTKTPFSTSGGIKVDNEHGAQTCGWCLFEPDATLGSNRPLEIGAKTKLNPAYSSLQYKT